MTDTINTYGDPRADAPHEWRRPAPEVTPASLRAHADYMERRSPGGISAEQLLQEAARLEAESARDEEAEKLARVIWESNVRSVACPWDRLSENSRDIHRGVARAVLTALAADGRLLPEVGVESDSCDRYLDGYYCTCAGPKPSGWVRCAKCLDAPPAVSVPDSGPWETADAIPADVAEIKDRVGKVWRRKSGGWCFMPGNSCGCVDGTLDTRFAPFTRVEEPDSGPDGTPEKPWEAWRDVPEGVRYWGRNRLYRWVNRDGRRMFLPLGGGEVPSSRKEAEVQALAPFVRVDGGKA
ncbi:hypothetical protein [Rhodococcus sp. BE178]|uniref:hypothetical protein n=1 Tax=Rhodococcus sp. BE178 TaxID=2817737 RepID=UPI003D25DCEB